MADWTPVQANGTTTGTGTSNSLGFGAPVTPGNVVAVWLLLQNGVNAQLPIGVSKITDDKNNIYRIVSKGFDGAGAAAGLTIVQARSLHPLTNGPQTITATTTVSASTFWVAIAELGVPTGCTDISLSGQQVMVNDTGATLPNFQTLDNDAFVIACSFSTAVSTTGAGFTAVFGSNTNQCIQSKIQATPTNTFSAVFGSQTGTTWAAAMAIAPVAQTRWEPIQSAINRAGTGTSVALAFDNPISAGSIIAGSIATDANGLSTQTSFKDNKNNNYSLISGTYNTGQGPVLGDRQSFWSNALLSNGPQTITASNSVSQTVYFLQATEFAPPPGTGTVAIDGTPTNTNNSNAGETATTTPNVTTTKSADLAYGWGDNAGLADKPGNSFSALNGQSMSWMTAYFITGAAGAYNFTCNHAANANGNDASLAIFSATPRSGGSNFMPLSLAIVR